MIAGLASLPVDVDIDTPSFTLISVVFDGLADADALLLLDGTEDSPSDVDLDHERLNEDERLEVAIREEPEEVRERELEMELDSTCRVDDVDGVEERVWERLGERDRVPILDFD